MRHGLIPAFRILLAGAVPAPLALGTPLVSAADAQSSIQTPVTAGVDSLRRSDSLAEEPVRFVAYDVWIDPHGRSLAAYQLEIVDAAGVARIVGIEGGEPPAFAEPPYYDPAAIQTDHVILAAYQTRAEVPHQATRVATLHVELPSGKSPEFQLHLTVATSPEGEDIVAAASVSKGER